MLYLAGHLPHFKRSAIFLNGGTTICQLEVDQFWDFPGGPVVKTSPSNAGGVGSTPCWRAKIPHASPPKKKKREHKQQKQYCNKFNKDFKNGPHQKSLKINSQGLPWGPSGGWGGREVGHFCRSGGSRRI